ncbi:MAG: hydantoinase B/oxoprolinase family protein [Betaproteobacteria bacterium]
MTLRDRTIEARGGAALDTATRRKPPAKARPADGKTLKLDVVTIEVMSRKFAAVADEMTTNLKRASRSVYVKEAGDFGTGLVDRDGHIFAFPAATSVSAIERPCGPTIQGVDPLQPGDVIITNDPYRSGGLATHLPDIHMVMPYFHKGRIVAYGWCFIHFMDVGGRVPSSISPANREIFQDGLIIPPTKLMKAGVVNQDMLNLIRANCRTPEQNLADIKAMQGALDTGGRRVADIIAQHGVETFLAAQGAVQDYAAAKTRAVLRRIPDGVYEFWDYMDDDLESRIPLRFRVKLTVKDGVVEVDATSTDPQVNTAFNLPTLSDRHPWLCIRLTRFILSHDKTTPLNYGIYRHIKAVNPPGTVVNAEFPDAVGVRHAVAQRFNDALNGTLMQACPDLMATLTSGVIVPVVLAEAVAAGKRNLTVIEPLVGGMGAFLGHDGVDTRDNSAANLSNHPLETIESEIGVRVREYDIRPDSGGPGRWRGGTGQVLTIEVLKDGGTVFARGMERMQFSPWGYGGGRPAAPLRVIFNRERPDERELRKIDALAVKAGDTVTFLSPGGGGYGDPFTREVQAVLRDVTLGFVSHEAAARDYGVVIDADGTVDDAATTRLRSARPVADLSTSFGFCAEREAWDAVFDDATMRNLNARLYALPKQMRQPKRRQIFETAVPELKSDGPLSLSAALADPDAVRARLRRAIDGIL